MGRFPLKIEIDKQILKYLYRLRSMDENTIVKQAFTLSEKLGKKDTRVFILRLILCKTCTNLIKIS